MTSKPFRLGRRGPGFVLLGALGFSQFTLTQACGDRSPPPDFPPSHSGGAGGESSSGGDGPLAGSSSGGDGNGLGGLGGDGAGGQLPVPTCANLHCTTGSCSIVDSFPVCECAPGFGGAECDDINECIDVAAAPACPGAECTNSFGSHYCGCSDDEVLDGEVCVDLNECDYGPCADGATCLADGPGFSCACASGTFGNGFDCVDTDPCAGDPCGDGATCVASSAGAVCQCPLGKSGPLCETECEYLNITDPALGERLYLEFGKYPNEISPATDLVNRTSLNLNSAAVRSLDGLECWTNLENLDLSYTPLGLGDDDTPLEALRGLTRLRELRMDCVTAPDLDVLVGSPQLQTLSLQRNDSCPQPADAAEALASLATLRSLRTLDVSGQPLGDGSVLAPLKALGSLSAANAGLSATANLEGLLLLRSLHLSGNSITDASGLAELSLLSSLSLPQNKLESVEFLGDMEGLVDVDVSETGIDQVKELPSSLRTINASSNKLTSLAPFAAAHGLARVLLNTNKIASLEPLNSESPVGDYFVSENPLDCGAEADNLVALRQGGLRITTDCDSIAAP